MKTEWKIFLPLTLFFLITAPIYAYYGREPIGVVALLLSFLTSGMIMGYFWLLSRRMNPRPEDLHEGEVAQGAGELGFFPPQSIWPFWVALSLAVIVLGPVFGWWITLLGMGLGLWALSGWVYEYYRGDYAH